MLRVPAVPASAPVCVNRACAVRYEPNLGMRMLLFVLHSARSSSSLLLSRHEHAAPLPLYAAHLLTARLSTAGHPLTPLPATRLSATRLSTMHLPTTHLWVTNLPG